MRKRDVQRLVKKKRKQAMFLHWLLTFDGVGEEIIGRGLDRKLFKVVCSLEDEASKLEEDLGERVVSYDNDWKRYAQK